MSEDQGMPEVTLPDYVVEWIVATLERRQAIEQVRGLGSGSDYAHSVADYVQIVLEDAGVMPRQLTKNRDTAAGRPA